MFSRMNYFSRLTGSFKQCVYNHYQDTTFVRSEQALEREKWLIPKLVPFNRYMLMPAAVLIQMCCGSLYAWSGYNMPIEAKLYGCPKTSDSHNGASSSAGEYNCIDRAIAVNVFYAAIAVFATSAALFGPWLERRGPLKGGLLGAFLFFLGNLVTALGVHVNSLTLIFIGYSVLGGAGLGLSYITPVSPLQKWFPEMRGLASGLAVCGFGAGSIFSPFTQKSLIGADYLKTGQTFLGIELTFVILGCCYFVVMSVSALVLRMPPPGYQVNGINIYTVKGAEKVTGLPAELADTKQPLEGAPDQSILFSMTLKESLLSLQYWMMYFMLLGAEISGLLIISKIQSIVQNQLRRPDDAAIANSALGGVNLLGRLVLPLISDLIHARKPLFILSLAVQIICLGYLPTAMDKESYAGVLGCALTIGFFYGGGFGMIPAFLADQFGAKNVGATHGVILTAWLIGAVGGGLLFTAVYNSQRIALGDAGHLQWYDLNFRWMLAPVIFSFFLCLFIPTNLHDRKLPRVPGETVRFRFINGRLIRFIGFWPIMVDAETEEQEWQAYLSTLFLASSRPTTTTLDILDESKNTFFTNARKADRSNSTMIMGLGGAIVHKPRRSLR